MSSVVPPPKVSIPTSSGAPPSLSRFIVGHGRVAGLVTAALELSCSAILESFVGEAWISDAGSGGGAPLLLSFVSPAALFVKGTNASGLAVKQHIDINLARAFSSEHHASQRLYASALKAGAPIAVGADELTGDALLSKISFPVQVAVAVPILGPPNSSAIVLVIYSSRKAGVSGW